MAHEEGTATTENRLHGPFHDTARQHEADRLGMLVFLASEVMLFGGLLGGALAIRLLHPVDYGRAAAQLHLWLGGLNTAILLTSSLLVALAVEAVRSGQARLAAWQLRGAMLLGIAFLAVKGLEYTLEYRDGLVPGLAGAHLESLVHALFMNLYFAATGLHALHVIGGLVLLGFAAASRLAQADRNAVVVGNIALYWHLVDVVWVFLYPTLYLARPA